MDSFLTRPTVPRSSIYDVARAAGVSVATVSRVLNGRPGVSEELGGYVREVISRLGYRHRPAEHRPGPKGRPTPAPTVRRVLDLFICHPLALGEFPSRAPIYSRMLDELEDAATGHGIEIFVRQAAASCIPPDIARSIIGRLYFAQGAAGIEQVAPWTDRTLPMVWLFEGDHADFPGHAVRVDNERVGEIAARHLLAHGHRHAAFIGTPPRFLDRPTASRRASFAWWFRQLGGEVSEWIDAKLLDFQDCHNQVDEAVLARVLDACLAQRPAPTAIFLEFALFAPSVWQNLVRRGIRPQKDVDLMVCNNDAVFLRGLSPPPWVIDIPCRQMAELALELIIRPGATDSQCPVRHLVSPILLR